MFGENHLLSKMYRTLLEFRYRERLVFLTEDAGSLVEEHSSQDISNDYRLLFSQESVVEANKTGVCVFDAKQTFNWVADLNSALPVRGDKMLSLMNSTLPENATGNFVLISETLSFFYLLMNVFDLSSPSVSAFTFTSSTVTIDYAFDDAIYSEKTMTILSDFLTTGHWEGEQSSKIWQDAMSFEQSSFSKYHLEICHLAILLSYADGRVEFSKFDDPALRNEMRVSFTFPLIAVLSDDLDDNRKNIHVFCEGYKHSHLEALNYFSDANLIPISTVNDLTALIAKDGTSSDTNIFCSLSEQSTVERYLSIDHSKVKANCHLSLDPSLLEFGESLKGHFGSISGNNISVVPFIFSKKLRDPLLFATHFGVNLSKVSQAARYKVFLLEDGRNRVDAIRRILGAQFDVFNIDSAELALKLLTKNSQYDVLIVDIKLSGVMSGADFIEALPVSCRGIPVIAMTCYPQYSPEVKRMNADVFISKPLDSELLRNSVLSLASRRKKNQ